MLGKVFEELVTGRHESGSYYTPRPIVSFMCREALKGYLTSKTKASPDAIGALVDQAAVTGLTEQHGRQILEALDSLKAVDPACGSGAYLLGLLHELVAIYRLLISEKLVKDRRSLYDLKLRIISHNLYGVDIDPFATSIAMLRLWLSLEVEAHEPLPLPNLDFKIETGDSLLGPDPSTMADLFSQQLRVHAETLVAFKKKYLTAHGEERERYRSAVAQLEHDIEKEMSALHGDGVIDWRVHFADVFVHGKGFDIVLANPPYLRQEVIKRQFGADYKAKLVAEFPETFNSTADIYVAFFNRALQLLRTDATGCFISSSKWLRAGYGEKLRQKMLDKLAFHLVVDFGELPVFQAAATFPGIFLWQKTQRNSHPTFWAVVKDLAQCYQDGVRCHVTSIGQVVPASQFGVGKPRLALAGSADIRTKMESRGRPIVEATGKQIYFGIKTGLNEAFIIDDDVRKELISQDSRSSEIIKPIVSGDDVRGYELHFRGTYLVWTYIGVPIKRYPAIFAHLKQHERALKARADQGNEWWELRACDYYDLFSRPKIIYPQMMKESRFVIDREGYFANKTAFTIPVEDWFLLAVLNSSVMWEYMKLTCSSFGDPEKGGRLETYGLFMEKLPIPSPSDGERATIAAKAKAAQSLHSRRRKAVERMMIQCGVPPAESTSRNPLEQPWTLTPAEFAKRAKKGNLAVFNVVRDETIALTDEIKRMEVEISQQVATLYGL
jgi:methylase of polypeptide subunit release factors